MIAVYQILCVPTRQRYIGGAVDVRVRWNGHRFALRRGNHENKRLQRAWTEHGEGAFVFSILKRLDSKSELPDAEQASLSELCPEFNVAKSATKAFLGLKHSDASKKRQSEAKIGKPSGFKGRTHAHETRERLRKASTGRKMSDETKAKKAEAMRRWWSER